MLSAVSDSLRIPSKYYSSVPYLEIAGFQFRAKMEPWIEDYLEDIAMVIDKVGEHLGHIVCPL